jgi:hypothetical protein
MNGGVLKISLGNLCICGGTNPPHPQFYSLKGGELNPKRLIVYKVNGAAPCAAWLIWIYVSFIML